MAAIRSKDTKPELALRRELRAAGAVGYRLHRRDLPGRPDLAYSRWKVAVFVDGVFWHGHPEHWHPERASDYWRAKIERNVQRDAIANDALSKAGWAVVRVWDLDVKTTPAQCVAQVLEALASRGWGADGS